MSPTRRTVLMGTGTALAAGLAGCLGEPLASFAASPATVSPAVLDGTGYEEAGVDEQVLSQGFGPAERAVEVRNWVARYERPLGAGIIDSLPGSEGERRPVAVFVALSTPEVTVAGQQFNPVAGLSANDIIERVQDAYGQVREVERVGERTVPALGVDATLVEYRAAGSVQGISVDGLTDISMHVSDPVAHGTDYVIAVGAHPALLGAESGRVDRLFGGLDHPADAQEN